MSKRKKPQEAPISPKALPEPGSAERAAIEAAGAATSQRPSRLKVNIETGNKNEITRIGPTHADTAGWLKRLNDTFGSRDDAFATAELNQLIRASRLKDGTIDPTRLNAFLSIIDSIKPENELEAMIACQLAVTHGLAMDLVQRTKSADQVPQFECAGYMAAKLLKAFAQQAELLNRLKRGGEQVVKVVHVHSGGQAIVGNVSRTPDTGGRSSEKSRTNPMHPDFRNPMRLQLVPRCHARTRSGNPCQSPVVKGKRRCRMHGGAKGSGAPKGERNGAYKHGQQTEAARAERGQLMGWIRLMRGLAREL